MLKERKMLVPSFIVKGTLHSNMSGVLDSKKCKCMEPRLTEISQLDHLDESFSTISFVTFFLMTLDISFIYVSWKL